MNAAMVLAFYSGPGVNEVNGHPKNLLHRCSSSFVGLAGVIGVVEVEAWQKVEQMAAEQKKQEAEQQQKASKDTN